MESLVRLALDRERSLVRERLRARQVDLVADLVVVDLRAVPPGVDLRERAEGAGLDGQIAHAQSALPLFGGLGAGGLVDGPGRHGQHDDVQRESRVAEPFDHGVRLRPVVHALRPLDVAARELRAGRDKRLDR